MMTFLNEFDLSDKKIKFYKGFELEFILSHPSDGSSGWLIILVECIKNEYLKFKRDKKINKILDDYNYNDLYEILSNIENKYLLIYQSKGIEDESLIKIVKEKFSRNQIW